MKKILFITAFILILLIFVLCGCRDVETTVPESTPSPVSSTAPTVPEPPSDETPPHKESPLALDWYSEEDYRAFREATALSDEELTSFLDREGYAREGIVSRTEFEKIIAYMDKMSPYFIKVHPSAGKVEEYFSLILETGYIDFFYKIDERVYRYVYAPSKAGLIPEDESEKNKDKEKASFVLGEKEFKLYIDEDKREGVTVPYYHGVFAEDDIHMMITIKGKPGDTSLSPTEVAALFAKDTPAID